MERRTFLRNSGAICLLSPFTSLLSSCNRTPNNKIIISKTAFAVEKEPLLNPFGFKGGYLTELWQTIAQVTSSGGNTAVGLGTQSVLWSDSTIFANH